MLIVQESRTNERFFEFTVRGIRKRETARNQSCREDNEDGEIHEHVVVNHFFLFSTAFTKSKLNWIKRTEEREKKKENSSFKKTKNKNRERLKFFLNDRLMNERTSLPDSDSSFSRARAREFTQCSDTVQLQLRESVFLVKWGPRIRVRCSY